MATVHIILQGKGGVGKSVVASFLTQYLTDTGHKPICVDTDPVNATFSGYRVFGAERFVLGERADEVNPRYFDELIERIMASDEDDVFVIDNGAATFLPLVAYLRENNGIRMLQDSGHTVHFHSVLTGGHGQTDTAEGLAKLLAYFNDVQIVVWLNGYFGRVVKNGKSFEQSLLYQRHMDRIRSIVEIPIVRRETTGIDMQAMLEQRLSFQEALDSVDFTLMARQRLKIARRDLMKNMAEAQL